MPAESVPWRFAFPSASSTVAVTVRFSSPFRTKECWWGFPATVMRVHLSLMMSTTALWMCACGSDAGSAVRSVEMSSPPSLEHGKQGVHSG